LLFKLLISGPRNKGNIPIENKQILGLDKQAHLDSISQFISSHATDFRGVVLDVGCGSMPYREGILASSSAIESYLGLDLESNNFDRELEPDLTWDGTRIPLEDDCVDVAIATEVFEHCPDTSLVVREIHRILKPDGVLLFTVPFLWPLHEVPHDYFRFTPFALQSILTDAGFKHTDLKMLGGWDASLAQMMGLWVVRRPGLNRVLRKLLKIVFTPVVWFLLKVDSKDDSFSESSMITGICGVARK
jgi:SAM-dependent methyltransferase